MVSAQYALLTQSLSVDHLRLILGTSMGCMHTFLWTEHYPGFMDAAMPLACLPVPIAGRDRVWRDLVMDSIRTDPEWLDGEYRSEPMQALHAAAGLLLIAGSAPIQMQAALPTRDAADEFLKVYLDREIPELDANDLLVSDQRLARLRRLRRAREDPGAPHAGSIRPTISSIHRISALRSPKAKRSRTRASSCCPPPTKRMGMARTTGPRCGSSIWASCSLRLSRKGRARLGVGWLRRSARAGSGRAWAGSAWAGRLDFLEQRSPLAGRQRPRAAARQIARQVHGT